MESRVARCSIVWVQRARRIRPQLIDSSIPLRVRMNPIGSQLFRLFDEVSAPHTTEDETSWPGRHVACGGTTVDGVEFLLAIEEAANPNLAADPEARSAIDEFKRMQVDIARLQP